MSVNVRRNLAVQLTAGGPNPLTLRLSGRPYIKGTPVNASLVGRGGTPAYAYSITAGALPAGLSLNSSTGAITGTPSAVGAVTFTAQVQDGVSTIYQASFTMNIGHILQPANASPTPMEQFTLYSYTFTVSGATGAVTWALTSGTLPPNLTLSAGGVLSGIPQTAAQYSFTITATDAGTGDALPLSFTVTVASAIVVNTTIVQATVIVGASYKQILPAVSPGGPFGAHGGVPPYKYSSSNLAALLPWATLDTNTGFLSGTPTSQRMTAQAVNYTITDSIGGISSGLVANITQLNAGISANTAVNEGSAPSANLGATMNAPTTDVTIPAGCSATVHRKLTIAAGTKLTIGLGAILRID